MIEAGSDSELYRLSKKAFLDTVWNRFGIIEFRSTSLYAGQVYPLPKRKDRFGRVKICLTINPDYTQEEQEHTLVHEVIHVDRQPWEWLEPPPLFSDEPEWEKYERERYVQEKLAEEMLTNEAATAFYESNRTLVRRALHHLWVRRIEPLDFS